MGRTVASFYTYRIISRLYFHLPIIFIYLYLAGMKLFLIEILLAAYGLTICLTSQISTWLVRFFKHKWVIALGEFLKAAGLFIILIKVDFWVVLAGQILTALGYSVAQGTDSSLLRTALSGNPEWKDQYNRVESNTQSYMFLSTLVSGIIGSILFMENQQLPFYGSILANLIALLAILFIPEEKPHTLSAKAQEPIPKLQLLPSQKFWMNYYSISRAFTLATYVGFLPFFFFTMLQISLLYFGLVLSLFSIAAFISARFIVRLSNRMNVRQLTFATMGLLLISLLLFASSDALPVSLAAITLIGLANGGVRPITMKHLNQTNLTPEKRTQILSSMEQLYGVYNAAILVAGGVLLGWWGFHKLMLVLAGAYLALLIFVFTRYPSTIAHSTEEQQTA